MGLFRKTSSPVLRAAMTLAAAGGAAHTAFFTLFVWRVIGRDGIGTVGYAVLALVALAGMGLDFVGFWLVRMPRARRYGFLAIALATALAGALLAIATFTA